MKRRILVTGADGFIGKNLISILQRRSDIQVLTFTRQDHDTQLAAHLAIADYVVHLAGEVRPDSSGTVFYSSNVGLTEKILKKLREKQLSTPILLVSSIHAKLLKNEYGKTKYAAELLIKKYIDETGSTSHIIRLPHVFGPGCKPNYNSVITTWMCNIINGEEITIYDRNIPMEYVYVKDIVEDFIGLIDAPVKDVYVVPSQSYQTTLGEVADYLVAFQKGEPVISSEFQQKLYDTFIDYQNVYNKL